MSEGESAKAPVCAVMTGEPHRLTCPAASLHNKNSRVFDIHLTPSGEIVMAGRLDATQCDAALRFLEGVAEPRVVDLSGLEYIASSGLRVFLLTQKRVRGVGAGLRLINVPPQIHDIFRYAGFDRIIEMSRTAS